MIKISAATQKELVCLCGICDHDCMDVKCPFNIMIDKKSPEEYMYKRVMFLMKKEIQSNTNTKKKAKNGTRTKQQAKQK